LNRTPVPVPSQKRSNGRFLKATFLRTVLPDGANCSPP
jgi:hypothetical protein